MNEATRLVRLPGGRTLAVDQSGDPDGVPVVWLHGYPDSRLSRHPDSDLTEECGVSLTAIDRPGVGASQPCDQSLQETAADLLAVLELLEIPEFSILAWSAGAPYAAAMALTAPERVRRLCLAAPVGPIESMSDPAVAAASSEGRGMLAEMAGLATPSEIADEIAPWLLPDPATYDHVAEMVHADADDHRSTDLADVPGAGTHLIEAMVNSVAHFRDGLHREVRIAATPSGLDLSSISTPTLLVCGAEDELSPPALAEWWASRLANATIDVIPGSGHSVVFRRWTEILFLLAA